MKNITKEQFEAFVDVQMSGLTNMLNTKVVAELSGDILTKKDVIAIISTYDALAEKYPAIAS